MSGFPHSLTADELANVRRADNYRRTLARQQNLMRREQAVAEQHAGLIDDLERRRQVADLLRAGASGRSLEDFQRGRNEVALSGEAVRQAIARTGQTQATTGQILAQADQTRAQTAQLIPAEAKNTIAQAAQRQAQAGLTNEQTRASAAIPADLLRSEAQSQIDARRAQAAALLMPKPTDPVAAATADKLRAQAQAIQQQAAAQAAAGHDPSGQIRAQLAALEPLQKLRDSLAAQSDDASLAMRQQVDQRINAILQSLAQPPGQAPAPPAAVPATTPAVPAPSAPAAPPAGHVVTAPDGTRWRPTGQTDPTTGQPVYEQIG